MAGTMIEAHSAGSAFARSVVLYMSKTVSTDSMPGKWPICRILASLIFVNLVITIAIGSMGYRRGNERSASVTTTSQFEWRPWVQNFLDSQTLTQIGDLKIPSLVTGVAYLDGCIYVSQKSNILLVFDAGSPNFDKISTIEVGDLRVAVDLAADQNRKLLYVADGNLRIWKVNPNDPTSGVASLLTDNFTPLSISFCEQSSQLIMVATGSRKLLVYNTNDSDDYELTMVQLPETIELRHAVRTSSGHFLVAHTGLSQSDLRHDQVSEFDGAGKLVRSYGGWRGYGAGKLNKPQYLAVADDGSVAVADSVNGRVVRLSSTLEYVETVVEGVPVVRLHLAEEQRQLIIGHKINVGVYQLG